VKKLSKFFHCFAGISKFLNLKITFLFVLETDKTEWYHPNIDRTGALGKQAQ
jgi:hypothetical protein